MRQLFGLLTTAIFLSVLPGSGLAQKDGGIPPMLETQRPLAMPESQPQPQPPQGDYVKPVSGPTKVKKTKKAQRKKSGPGKSTLAEQKKPNKTIKKKGQTATPKGKSAAKAS